MSEHITKKDVLKHIHTYKKNTFLTHLWYSSKKPFTGHIDETNNLIYIWFSSFWARRVYPVFKLRFDDENNLTKIEPSINKFGKALGYFLIAGYLLPLFLMLYDAKITHSLISFLIVWSLCFIIIIFLPRSIYSFEAKIAYQKLCYVIGINEEPITKKPKGFSILRIITRIVFYPLSIFLIYLGLTIFFAAEAFLYGTIIFLIGFSYLISDILLIIKPKKKK
ncbi:hypothetical protein [Aquimarina brevivitae]|uniref:Uncharacterized protein n=1 Tax=Aquimarina brevivitae TaxID=323412 RepID=A0A4Q7PGJ6_9FLAO|nr:hypothetical protein [Aquimarina brevivitae]RZS99626.1 hypothetical protein EV197_0849 [Aquimarina brevivitae]